MATATTIYQRNKAKLSQSLAERRLITGRLIAQGGLEYDAPNQPNFTKDCTFGISFGDLGELFVCGPVSFRLDTKANQDDLTYILSGEYTAMPGTATKFPDFRPGTVFGFYKPHANRGFVCFTQHEVTC